jgi:hypothetical protein
MVKKYFITVEPAKPFSKTPFSTFKKEQEQLNNKNLIKKRKISFIFPRNKFPGFIL